MIRHKLTAVKKYKLISKPKVEKPIDVDKSLNELDSLIEEYKLNINFNRYNEWIKFSENYLPPYENSQIILYSSTIDFYELCNTLTFIQHYIIGTLNNYEQPYDYYMIIKKPED